MPIPFLLGLVAGAGVAVAFNKRSEIKNKVCEVVSKKIKSNKCCHEHSDECCHEHSEHENCCHEHNIETKQNCEMKND